MPVVNGMRNVMAIKANHSNMQIIGSEPNSFPAQPLESYVKKIPSHTFLSLLTPKKAAFERGMFFFFFQNRKRSEDNFSLNLVPSQAVGYLLKKHSFICLYISFFFFNFQLL